MRFFIILAAVACFAIASPRSTQSKANQEVSTFQIVYNNRSQKVKAANNTLYIGSSKQRACCNQMNAEDAATFFLQDKELFLYSPGNPKQQVIVDSPKCKAHARYSIGSRSDINKKANKGWRIDSNGGLTFNGSSLMTCGGSNLARDVLVYDGNNQPDKSCRNLTTKATNIRQPTSCLYTGEGQVVSYYCLSN
ncbi:cell wall [Fusarium sporotrichioides]|uniref:Cell wall n=1 Tax=Fusarium sporotrichioides TaxID=5514 RepID=A0A395RTS5_FUSSP|nr:cell wall [Fusarium sporotrichioides]